MVVDVSTFWDSVAERFCPCHTQGATREWTLSHFLPSISWRTQIDCLRQHSYGQRPTPSCAQGLRKRRTGRLPLGSTYLPGFMGIFQKKWHTGPRSLAHRAFEVACYRRRGKWTSSWIKYNPPHPPQNPAPQYKHTQDIPLGTGLVRTTPG